MQFSTKEDIEAPIEATFALFTDFEKFERSALRRGVEIRRTDSYPRSCVGMGWTTVLKIRGKKRKIDAEMVAYDPSESFAIEVQSKDVTAHATFELMALSKSRTRASFSVELKAKSLSGRLMVQALRLGKTRLDRRFKSKSADFVRSIEEQHLKASPL